MATIHTLTTISTGFGLLLFIVSGWFLKTIIGDKLSSGDVEWENNRKNILSWGNASSIGAIVGIFQFLFSLVHTLQALSSTQGNQRMWNIASMILNFIFLISLLFSLVRAFRNLSQFQFEIGGNLAMTFVIFEVIDTTLILIVLFVFENECHYATNMLKIFSCIKVRKYLVCRNWKRPWQNQGSEIPMERLEELSVSV